VGSHAMTPSNTPFRRGRSRSSSGQCDLVVVPLKRDQSDFDWRARTAA